MCFEDRERDWPRESLSPLGIGYRYLKRGSAIVVLVLAGGYSRLMAVVPNINLVLLLVEEKEFCEGSTCTVLEYLFLFLLAQRVSPYL